MKKVRTWGVEGFVNPGLLVCWAPVLPVDGERLWKEMTENLDQLKAFYIHQLSLRCVGMERGWGVGFGQHSRGPDNSHVKVWGEKGR